MLQTDKLFREIESELLGKQVKIEKKEVGSVLEVKDEVVSIDGLANVSYGEMLTFSHGISGLVIDLTEELVGAIVFGEYEKIREGSRVTATGKIFSIPVGSGYLGRVVDGIGRAIDGKSTIKAKEHAFVDRIAPGVVARKPVDTPVQTGIKAIDGLIPIGRGQRELIIGDRRIGKTTLALDTILNQKNQNIICVYAAIGQRRSATAAIIELFSKEGAMDYTIVVSASSSDPAAMQYIAPYTACTIGEYFMDQGKDVLVVYDDLTKHAWAYRQVSLILRRPAGREAYPGDVFYLHSRLLERACNLDKKYGGGSLTALPIIETQEGDVSAYIPTNVISITDGQIVLEADLFNEGMRPAINVGASVSRVGGTAQTKAMKQVAGKLKLDLAQYRELAAFAQFESDLDEQTKKLIDRGSRMTQLLKQNKHQTYSLSEQVILFHAGASGHLDELPVKEIEKFEKLYLDHIRLSHTSILEQIENEKKINEKIIQRLDTLTKEFIKTHFMTKEQNTKVQ